MTDIRNGTRIGKSADIRKLTDTGEPDRSGDHSLDCVVVYLILPAFLIIDIWGDITWAAWIAVVVGLLGLVLTPVAIYDAIKHRSWIGLHTWFLGGLLTYWFVTDTWAFLF